ncbi:MAG: squalene--hopene cyclase, partial [Limisphaerales bacterium]
MNQASIIDSLDAAITKVACTLLASRHANGKWVGELSSSALSTATAVCALATVNRSVTVRDQQQEALISSGLRWLAENQNSDGGWGDTTLSLSNISTTA